MTLSPQHVAFAVIGVAAHAAAVYSSDPFAVWKRMRNEHAFLILLAPLTKVGRRLEVPSFAVSRR